MSAIRSSNATVMGPVIVRENVPAGKNITAMPVRIKYQKPGLWTRLGSLETVVVIVAEL